MTSGRGSGGYYHSHGHYGPPTGHYGLPASNVYSSNASLNVNCEIPDQSALMNDQPWLLDSGIVGVNQKLDKLMKLMEEQKDETAVMKSDISSLKSEVQEVRTIAKAATAESLKSTPSSKKLPTELCASVKLLQTKSTEHLKFNGTESYKSQLNQKVKHHLIDQLASKYKDKYSPRKIKKAVHRYYESRRRIHNDSQPSRSSSAKKVKKNARKKELRKRAYAARRKCLRKKHLKKWDEINYLYMTEESSCSDEDGFNVHQLPWRSEELDKLVKKADKKRLKRGDSKFTLKTRIPKSPSHCPKPADAPDWTCKPEFQTTITNSTVNISQTAPLVESTETACAGPSSTPQRNPTGGAVARQIFNETGSSSSSESSSYHDSDSE